ncbi:hypothetical protein DOTSEDRAFT_73504 [Dothistroma septosporum NZE10]|uniref:SH3 domain-containing protein n=1 Tax=Dothistroma septosporum (strain NZE10 / CBS 128990) TaxID=675120 RepID=N1PK02_DOTSN|nr:hypothetical protein DOTSEDRAFT_73504 [Dothistroma septosporum NZE10]
MGLHKRHMAGRVLRDDAARAHLAMHKRDSHGDQPIMHVPEGFQAKQLDDSAAVSVVYVTLPQTFSGAAVYSTLGTTPTADSNAQATDDASYASALASYSSAMSVYDAAKSASASPTSVAVVTPKSSAHSTLATALQNAALASTAAATYAAGTPIQATRAAASATSTSDAQIEQSSSGLSGGAKAGLAFGIILAFALAAGLIFFCWRRKKNSQQQEAALNEKHGSFADAGARRVEAGGPQPALPIVAAAAGRRDSSMTEKVPASLRSSRTASTAPRLSLRPVTQFLPNLGETNGPNRSVGSNLDVAAGRSGWERAPAVAQQNPFDDATAEKQAPQSNSPPQNPFDEPEDKRSSDSQDAARAAGVAAGAAVMASKKHSPKSSWEGSESATPKSSRFATAAAVPVAAAGSPRGPPPPRGPNNVHRVQLDFKPSMEDELELVSGQLVRMLHEYDDGWALCIRMDRSQQGVAPRTCLSKLPVKPRPQGPPPQGSRPGTSQGPRRPSNATPPGPNGPMHQGPVVPRPLTPSQGSRSPSLTSSNGEASTSTSGGSAKIGRKPVPGQAM